MEHITCSKLRSTDFYYDHTISENFDGTILTHTHNTCELLFVVKGNLTYVVEGKKYPLSKNSLIVTRALETHALIANEATDYERYNILFDESTCGTEIFRKIPSNVDVINLNGNELVCGLFKKMEYYCGNSEGEILQTILQHLTSEILFNVILISREQNSSDACTANAVITQAIRYINDNITETLQIERICNALFITKSHLHRLFLTHLNTTPKKYIMEKKLRMAQAEMQTGTPPTEVAVRYGFANYATFYRNYKQHFGVVPSDWTAVTIEQNFF